MHTVHSLFVSLTQGEHRRLLQAVSLASALSSLPLAATDMDADTGANPSSPSPDLELELAEGTCSEVFAPSARYPRLPEVEGADVVGEPGVLVHLQHHRGVVELDGCLYELDRPLEIDHDGLGVVSVLLELHDAGGTFELFVSSDAAVETHSLAEPFAVFSLGPSSPSLGFELAAPGQSAPTVPVVVAKPVDEDPPPN